MVGPALRQNVREDDEVVVVIITCPIPVLNQQQLWDGRRSLRKDYNGSRARRSSPLGWLAEHNGVSLPRTVMEPKKLI